MSKLDIVSDIGSNVKEILQIFALTTRAPFGHGGQLIPKGGGMI